MMRMLYVHNPYCPNGRVEYDETYDTLKINELPPPKHSVWWHLRRMYDLFTLVAIATVACMARRRIRKT